MDQDEQIHSWTLFHISKIERANAIWTFLNFESSMILMYLVENEPIFAHFQLKNVQMALSPSILEIWKNVQLYICSSWSTEFKYFILGSARAFPRAARARWMSQKSEKSEFSKKCIFALARSARASARVNIWCALMYSPDPGDIFWLLDCYSSFKIGENRIWWNLVKNRIFVEKNWFFFEIFRNFRKWANFMQIYFHQFLS